MKKNTVHAFRVRTAFMIKMEALVIIKQAFETKNTILYDEKYNHSR